MATAAIPAMPVDERLLALDRVEATLAKVRRAAGQGLVPELERELHAHLRSLRAMLDGDTSTLAEDVVDAAKRVLDSSDPAAPLKVLGMAQRMLAARLQRQASMQPLPNAA